MVRREVFKRVCQLGSFLLYVQLPERRLLAVSIFTPQVTNVPSQLQLYVNIFYSLPFNSTPIVFTTFILFKSHVHCIYSLNSNHILYIFPYSFATTCFHGRHFVFLPNSKDISNISTTTTPINVTCSSVTSLMHHYIHTGI